VIIKKVTEASRRVDLRLYRHSWYIRLILGSLSHTAFTSRPLRLIATIYAVFYVRLTSSVDGLQQTKPRKSYQTTADTQHSTRCLDDLRKLDRNCPVTDATRYMLANANGLTIRRRARASEPRFWPSRPENLSTRRCRKNAAVRSSARERRAHGRS